MLCKILKSTLLTVLLFTIFTSCTDDIHREGKMLFYQSTGSELFIIYQNKDQNYLFRSELSPLTPGWDKVISGHPSTPAFFFFDDMIFLNCRKDMVCLLDSKSSETLISVKSPLVVTLQSKGFVVNDDVLYTICDGETICAHNIKTGIEMWKFQLKADEKISVQFIVDDGLLFYGNDSGEVVALDMKKGVEKFRVKNLEDLSGIYPFPETVVADSSVINGYEKTGGDEKWINSYEGKVRCVTDGFIVAQSSDFFSVLYAENGMESWSYPRAGTTFLNCQETLALAAFTVKNLEEDVDETEDVTEYFDKVYIFDVASSEKIFDYRSSEGKRVLNITGFMTDRFHIALENRLEKYNEITVKKFSTTNFEEEIGYVFSHDLTNDEIYVSFVHSDINYAVIRVTEITDPSEETNYLFESSTGDLLGRMGNYPEIVNGQNAYDIIPYDDYFNIVEKTLPDFLLND